MKTLIAFCCCLFTASLAFGQAMPYAPEEGLYWIDGKTVVITYSPTDAPAAVPPAAMAQALADVEAKLNSLNLPGLHVTIGRLDLPNACAHRERNVVHVCWEPRDGRRADSIMSANTDGSTFWRESVIVLGNQADWTDPTRPLYQQLQHYLLHILGFAHPSREPGAPASIINNNAFELTQLDIDGLAAMYGGTRCALRYYEESGQVYVPYVTYRGHAYTARLQHVGGGQFTIVPGSLGMYGSARYPLTPCQSLVLDDSGELHLPQVWVGGSLNWATLQFANERFTLVGRGQ